MENVHRTGPEIRWDIVCMEYSGSIHDASGDNYNKTLRGRASNGRVLLPIPDNKIFFSG
jgi:hypothetical protein